MVDCSQCQNSQRFSFCIDSCMAGCSRYPTGTDTMMENRRVFTSPAGSSNGNPPERCPRPLYAQSSRQVHQEGPREGQGGSLIVVKVEKEPYVRGDGQFKEEEIPSFQFKKEEIPSFQFKKEEIPSFQFKEEEIPSFQFRKEEIPSRQFEEEEIPSEQFEEEEEIPPEISTGRRLSLRRSCLDGRRRRMDTYVEPGELVYLIQARPELWDVGSSGYSNYILKNRSWEAVTKHFFPDFAKRSLDSKMKLIKEMKKKWKSLRDRFKKDLKMEKQSQSGQGPMKYKFHPLYHELSFLIPSLARGPTGNAEDDDDDENESQPQQQQRSVGQTKSGPSTNRAEGSSDSAFLAAENLDVSHILSPSSSYPPPKKSKPDPKKKTSNVDIVRMIEKVTESVESAVRPKDDISHFTKSLEGDIRKVAPQRLTKLKLDIMKAVFDAQQPERQQESFTPSTAQYPSIFYTTQSSNYPQRLSSPQASTNSFAILSNQSSPYTYAPGYPHSAFYYQAPQSSQTRFTSHPTFERLPPTGHSTNESQGSPLQTQSRSSTPLPEDIGQNVRGAKN